MLVTWTQPPTDYVDEYVVSVSSSPIGCGITMERITDLIQGFVRSMLTQELEEFSHVTIVVIAYNENGMSRERANAITSSAGTNL